MPKPIIISKREYIKITKMLRPLCSGFRVFPGGKGCKGCPDCGHKTNKNPKKPITFYKLKKRTK